MQWDRHTTYLRRNSLGVWLQELDFYKASQKCLVVLRATRDTGISALSGLAAKAEAGDGMKDRLFSHRSRTMETAWCVERDFLHHAWDMSNWRQSSFYQPSGAMWSEHAITALKAQPADPWVGWSGWIVT